MAFTDICLQCKNKIPVSTSKTHPGKDGPDEAAQLTSARAAIPALVLLYYVASLKGVGHEVIAEDLADRTRDNVLPHGCSPLDALLN